MDANFTTTVNGETTVHSAEAAQHVLVLDFWLYSSLQFFNHFWNYRYDEEKTNTIASGVFYIIGAILSLNMITFISWLVCGILLIKKTK